MYDIGTSPKNAGKMGVADSVGIFFPCKETPTTTTNEWFLIGDCCEIYIIENAIKTKPNESLLRAFVIYHAINQ